MRTCMSLMGSPSFFQQMYCGRHALLPMKNPMLYLAQLLLTG